MDKPRIMMMFPGPAMTFQYTHMEKFKALSEHYSGCIVITGEEAETGKLGDFDYQAHPVFSANPFKKAYQFYQACKNALASRVNTPQEIEMIVAYDPIKLGLIGLILKKLYKVKLLVEVNGDFTAIENHASSRFTLINKLRRWVFMRLEKFVLKRADGIRLLYDNQIEWTGIDKHSHIIERIFDYSGLESFQYIKHTDQVLFIGSPYYLKGVDILIAAFKKIATQYPSWKLTIVGWFTNLDEVLAEIDNHPQIEYRKPVMPKEVRQLMGECGFFVLPSRTEAMGRVLLEAMASRKARVGSNVGGIPTVIQDGHDGLLFEPENVDSLAQALSKLMSQPELRERMGESAQQRLAAEFCLSEYIRKTHALYSRVLNR
ncbi:glycosyltransferase family 4 protein [Aliikangiella sp. IMCC44653]